MDLITQAGFFAAAGASASGEAAEATDDNFQDTVLLLHGDGTDGAGNTSALGDPNYKALRENSANREVIATGNPYGTDFSPYYFSDGYWSNYFDGSNDYLNIPDHPTLRIGTSDFTIEFWVLLHSKTGYTTFYDKGYTNTGGILLQSNNNSSDVRVFFASGPDFTSSSEIPLNTWTHVALVRASGTATLYFDGTSVGSASNSDDLNNTSVVQIGRGSTSYYLDGYISNFRLVKRAIYTSTFTPPTTPFTDPTTSGELSVYFDGNGDYLKADNTGDLDLGTGDFTIEAWLYLDSAPHDYQMIVCSDGGNQYVTLRSSSVAVRITSEHTIGYGTTPVPNEWFHLAVVRSGSTISVYIDGSSMVSTATDSGDFNLNSGGTLIGAFQGPTHYFDGYISNLRITKQALYTSNFTPSTSPFTTTSQSATSSNVALLTCQSKIYSDESTSEHPIIVNGNTKVSEFGPFGDGYWSVDFDGTADKLTSSSDVIDLNTSSFTAELWFKQNGNGNLSDSIGNTLLIIGASSTSNALWITVNNSGLPQARIRYNGSAWETTLNSSGTAVDLKVWHHVALVKDTSDSNSIKFFVNGSLVASGTNSTDLTSFGQKVGIGGQVGANRNFNGLISNLRVVVGSALYTTTFTPSTSPLTTTSQSATASEVKLLTCQSNRFIDNSSNEVALTTNGDEQVSEDIPFEYLKRQTKLITCQGNRFKDIIPERWAFTIGDHPIVSTNMPFTTTKANNVGSVYLSATTDDLEIKVSDLPTGASARCMEFWVYLPEQTYRGDTEYLVQYGAQGSNQVFSAAIVNSSGKPRLRFIGYSSDYTTDDDMEENAWNFVSVVYTGSAVHHYLNGRLVHQSTRTLNTASHTALWVNAEIGGGDTYVTDKFYIADLAVYDIQKRSGNFLPPTTTVANTTNTKVLTAQYSGAVRNIGLLDDSNYNHVITRINNAHMGTFSPFSLEDGYWSFYFDGNHPMEVPDTNNALDLPGDFTVEFWAYEPKFATTNGTTNLYFTVDGLDHFQLGSNASQTFFYNGGLVFNVAAPTLNQWNHLALVREGTGSNNLSIYRNGTRLAQATNSTSFSAGSMMIGGQDRGSTTGYHGLFGWISNFRIVKGTAVYSGSSYTVPTEPLTAISGTTLLTCQSNRIIDNSTNDAGITTNISSATKVQPFSPFTPSRSYSKDAVGGSVYNDGSDGLKLTDATRALGTSDLEIEFWYYPTSSSGNKYLFGANFGPILLYINSGETLVRLYSDNDGGSPWNIFAYKTLGNIRMSQWNHIYLSRVSSAYYAFINGTASSQNGDAWSTNYTLESSLYIGTYDDSGSGAATGYISNLKYNIGSGSTTKSVPTAPTTPDSNTYVHLNFSNAGIIDHTMKNNLETVNNTRIRTDVKQLNTGSIYFDGSSDELNINDTKSDTFYFGTGKFTIEAFIRVESGSSSSGQWFTNEGHGGWAAGGIAIWHYSTISIYFHDFNTGSPLLSHAGSYNDGVMRHYAIVRGDSGACALFVDGTRVSTGTHTGNVGRIGGMCIGAYKGITSRNLKGFIDEMRVTRGVARYDPSESSITVPTESFANR